MGILERIQRRQAVEARARELMQKAVDEGLSGTDAMEYVSGELEASAREAGISPGVWLQLLALLVRLLQK